MLGLFAALAVAAAGAWIWRVRLSALYRGRVDDDGATASLDGDTLPVSIVVPARNEAHNLPALLDSLAALRPAPAQIIVVDDHSTDGTGELARSRGADVVVPDDLPPGWIGKPWACRAGAAHATQPLLLFTDADTVHDPASVGRAVAHLRRERADLVSVVPTHIVRAGWERLQGVFQLLLLLACRAGGRAASGERRFAIGQYMLWRRDAYEAVGCHDAVANRVAEDLAFARLVEAAGRRYALLFSPGLLRVRMYPEGFGAFVRGWRRNFREGMRSAGAAASFEVVLVIGWLLGAPLHGIAAAVDGRFDVAAVWALTYAAGVWAIARRQRALGPFPAMSAFAYPVFVAVFAVVSVLAAVDSLRGAPVRWRGRVVTAKPSPPRP